MHRVKELREAKGISARKLALATGLSHSTIARIERGERKLSTPQAIAIASYFGVSVDYLLGKSPEEMFNDFVDTMRGDFLTETMHSDGEVSQSLASMVHEPMRSKLEILFLLREVNSPESLSMILELAKLRRATEDFSGED